MEIARLIKIYIAEWTSEVKAAGRIICPHWQARTEIEAFTLEWLEQILENKVSVVTNATEH